MSEIRSSDRAWLPANCFRARRTGNGQNADGRQGVRGYGLIRGAIAALSLPERANGEAKQMRGDFPCLLR